MKKKKKRMRLVKITFIFIMSVKLTDITLVCWRRVDGKIFSTVDAARTGAQGCPKLSARTLSISPPHVPRVHSLC